MRRRRDGLVALPTPPTLAPVRIAAADLGSNSFHLLIVQAHPDGSFDTLVREKEMLRIGDVVSRTGRITESAQDAILDTLRTFRAVAEKLEADEVVACATAALREATNSAAVVDRIGREVGIDVRVISGRDEARLIFQAVRSSIVLERPPALCLDLGGGSLELSVGDAGGMHWCDSVKLGVARLTAELAESDPVRPDELKRLRKRVEGVLGELADDVLEHAPQMLVGTSGTLCDLARVVAIRRGADQEALDRSVNQLTVDRPDLEALHDDLVAMPAAKRAELAGLEARRADLIVAGSTVLLTAMRLFGFDQLTVGEWALREGIVLDAIRHHDPVDWSDDPRAMRRASVLSLCRRCEWDEDHGRQVARLSVDLFDRTRRLHRLAADDRELLHHAALLHDIGEHVAVEAHHKHTAYLIQHGRLRGFSPDEVAMLASIGRFHRRTDPRDSFEPYAALDPADKQRVVALTALLRVADGLDRSHSSVVEAIDVDVVGDRVRLTAHACGDAELERWGLRRKAELLERVLGRTIECVLDEQHHAPLATPPAARELTGTG